MEPISFDKARAVSAGSSGTQLLDCRYQDVRRTPHHQNPVRNLRHDTIMKHSQFLPRFDICPIHSCPQRRACHKAAAASPAPGPSLGLETSRLDGKTSQPCLRGYFLQNRETKNLAARPWTNQRIICLIRRLCRQVATPMSLHSLFECHQLLFGGGGGKPQNPCLAAGYPQAADVELSRWNRWRMPNDNAWTA
jgi:hypothetical protein